MEPSLSQGEQRHMLKIQKKEISCAQVRRTQHDDIHRSGTAIHPPAVQQRHPYINQVAGLTEPIGTEQLLIAVNASCCYL